MATSVVGKLVNPAGVSPANSVVTVTLVDYADESVIGFDTTGEKEIISTYTVNPNGATGIWSLNMTPNADIELLSGQRATAYRITESGGGAGPYTYWIVVTDTPSTNWAGNLRTVLVAGSDGTQVPDDLTVPGGLSVAERMTLNGFYVPSMFPRTRPTARRAATWFENFQSGHGYSATGTGVVPNLNDTTDFVKGTQSAAITTSGAGDAANIRKTAIGTTLDLTGKAIRLTFKVTDVTKLSQLIFYVGSSSFSNFFNWQFHGHSAVNPNLVQSGEWVTITLHWSDVSVASGSYSITAGLPSTTSGFTDLQFRVIDNATGTCTMHLQSIEVISDTVDTFPNGVISITFDDSYVTQYSLARPKMDALGYRATAYTIADVIGSNHSVYMNLSELKSLQNFSGWEVAGHAYSGSQHAQTRGYADSTDQEVRDEFTMLKLWLVKNGFNSDNFAYPKGHFGVNADNTPVDQIAAEFWSTSRTIISETKENFPPTMPQRIRAKTGISSAGTTVASVTASGGMLDRTKGSGDWLILCLHKIVVGSAAAADEISQSDFNTLMDAIASRGIPVLPINEVIAYYS